MSTYTPKIADAARSYVLMRESYHRGGSHVTGPDLIQAYAKMRDAVQEEGAELEKHERLTEAREQHLALREQAEAEHPVKDKFMRVWEGSNA